jgi:membrane-bound inhibitor of C-type lysozyme
MNKKLIIFIAVLLALGAALFFYLKKAEPIEEPIKVSYLCNNEKTIEAVFYKGEPVAILAGEMPIPTGSVDLILSDGRQMSLKRTISASGVRYADENESFIFWSKGNGALVLEDNTEKSYIGCVVLGPNPGNLPNAYVNSSLGFSVRYPVGYVLNKEYKYQGLGPGKDIYGVKFTIPASLAEGKNLSSFDTGVSIEVIPAVSDCQAQLFLSQQIDSQRIADHTNVEYFVASVNEGAAGNRYEEKVWALVGSNPCVAVRYLVHSTNLENYDPGTIEQFDPRKFLENFDLIRQSLVLQ